jgi:hypothetical protein
LPLPLAPLVIVIQVSPLVAVQAQPAPAVTEILLAPPFLEKLARVGEIEYEHDDAAPASLTVSVSPAIVIVPLRCDIDAFASTE